MFFKEMKEITLVLCTISFITSEWALDYPCKLQYKVLKIKKTNW